MEHIYKIDVEEFAESICSKVIERLTEFDINNGDTEETRIKVTYQDSEVKTEG